jgi:hypothetical protein
MLYISGGKKLEGKWMLGWTKHTEHNHSPLADPFSEPKLRHYRPHHSEAIALASSHHGIMTAKQNAKVLGKKGFKIKDKEFYNLFRKESKLDMSREEELALLMGVLERSGFHPRVREEYILVDEVRTGRMIREIFFMSSDQILKARRFVSGFMYETDATFNTNKLRLLLSVMVGIDNTGKTFPMAFMYHTTESAKAFKFASEQLTDLAFYDCLEAAVICGDFSKGLGAAVKLKAFQDQRWEADPERDFSEPRSVTHIDEDTIVVEVAVGKHSETTLLQLCEWHAVEAIKKRMVDVGRYSKETRKEITTAINEWVKAQTLEALEEKRKALFKLLCREDVEYIERFYRPKEHQFIRAYTTKLRNLGSHSTQRNESYHVVVKKELNPHLQLSDAIEELISHVNRLHAEYNERINNDRRHLPRIYDKFAFAEVGSLLTHYAIGMVMEEWVATQDMFDAIQEEEVDLFQPPEDGDEGCGFECQLPLRFRLPCKHWMYEHFYLKTPLPIGLFHPRWLLDGPAVITRSQPWKMSRSRVAPNVSADYITRDRYEDDGEQLIIHTMHKVVDKLKSLPAGQKEAFASCFVQGATCLTKHQDNLTTSRSKIPTTLPDTLPQSTAPFARSRKRRLTGRELADRQEKDRIRNYKRAIRDAEAAQREGEGIAQEMRDNRATAITRRDLAFAGKIAATAIEVGSDSDSPEVVPEGGTEGADREVAIKIEPGFEPEDKGDALIRGDRDSDYGSIISDLTQFQTQDFVGVGMAAFGDINASSDDDAESTNEQFESSSDDEEPLPDSPPQASLPTFSSTAPLPTRQPHKPSAKQQSLFGL